MYIYRLNTCIYFYFTLFEIMSMIYLPQRIEGNHVTLVLSNLNVLGYICDFMMRQMYFLRLQQLRTTASVPVVSAVSIAPSPDPLKIDLPFSSLLLPLPPYPPPLLPPSFFFFLCALASLTCSASAKNTREVTLAPSLLSIRWSRASSTRATPRRWASPSGTAWR